MDIEDQIKNQTGLGRQQAVDQGKYLIKSTKKFEAIDEENHTVRIVINDNSVDRDGEVILPKSFEEMLPHYLETGVVLFAHNYHQPPIAKMIDHRIDENEFVAFDQFAVNEYEFALTCWNLCSNGYLKSASVGFIPIAWEDPTEEKSLPGQTGVTYTKCELLEHSILPIGSNRNALIKIYQETKEHWDPVVVKMIEKMIDQPKELECGHLALYDVERNIISPCPICEIENYEKEKEKQKDEEKEETKERIVVSEDKIEPNEKPYPNEHACRLRNPDQYKTCRRNTRKSDGKEYSVIYCQRKDDSEKWEEQAYRYNKNVWTVDQAKKHCNDHNGTLFEPASKEENTEDNQKSKEQDLLSVDKDIKIKNIFTLSGRTEESEGHDHLFRIYKDENGVIAGNTLSEWDADEKYQHTHLIVKHDSTEKYEDHQHEIAVFKSSEEVINSKETTDQAGESEDIEIEGNQQGVSDDPKEYNIDSLMQIIDRINNRLAE